MSKDSSFKKHLDPNWQHLRSKKAAQTAKARYGDDYFSRRVSDSFRQATGGGFGAKTIGKDGLTGRERAILQGELSRGKKRRHKKRQSN